MKKLLALLFTFAILYSSSSYSNILDDLLSGMSPADIELYEKSFTDVGFKPKNAALGNYVPSSNFQAKIKNLNQEKSAKQIYIRIKTLDCNKGCKNCIEVDEAVYEVLEVKEFDLLSANLFLPLLPRLSKERPPLFLLTFASLPGSALKLGSINL